MSQMQDPSIIDSNCNPTEKRVSQYEHLMRKFSRSHKQEQDHSEISIDLPKIHRSTKEFPTGSTYKGTWDVLGMSGTGVYTFPNGVVYRGEFDDGVFHGTGELQYPSGEVIRGKFRHGCMEERTLVFADGLEYSETDWRYCKMPDRRFTTEYTEGLEPAGSSNLTAETPTRKIPPGHYDTGDGFFNPNTNLVYDPDDLNTIIRYPSENEQKWIIDNCRASTMESLGPRPDLYETWVDPEVEPTKTPESAVPRRFIYFLDSNSNSTDTSLKDEEDIDVEWITELKSEIPTQPSLRFNPSIKFHSCASVPHVFKIQDNQHN